MDPTGRIRLDKPKRLGDRNNRRQANQHVNVIRCAVDAEGCSFEFSRQPAKVGVQFRNAYPQLALWATDIVAHFAGWLSRQFREVLSQLQALSLDNVLPIRPPG